MKSNVCGAECVSVVHVLWECSAYSTYRDKFREELKELLRDRYRDFDQLSNIDKIS